MNPNPFEELLKLLSANPNLPNAALLKKFPQLKGMETSARALVLGHSRGWKDYELEESFPEVFRALTPPEKSSILQLPKEKWPTLNDDPMASISSKPAEPKKETKKRVLVDPNDPVATALSPIRDMMNENQKKQEVYRFQNQFSDNVRIAVPEAVKQEKSQTWENIASEDMALRNEMREIKRVQKETPIPYAEAKKQINTLLKEKDPSLEADVLSIQQIDQYLPNNIFGSKNETAQWLLSKYEQHRNVSDAFKNSKTFQEAAFKFQYYSNKENYDKLAAASGGDFNKVPPAAMGAILDQFYSTPEVQQWAELNDTNKAAFQKAKAVFFTKYPTYGKRVISEVMAEERAKKGWNNAAINLLDDTDGARETENDKLYKELVASGKLPAESEALYKEMRGKLDYYIPTPGISESMLSGAKRGFEDMGSFFTDWFKSGEQATYEALENQYSTPNPNFKGWQEITHSTGEFTGQLIPMMLVSKGLSGAGLSPNVANAVSVSLAFEHPNRERAALLFPNDKGSQSLYTALSTMIDVAVGSLYHRSKALDVVEKEAKDKITSTIKALSAGEIEQAVARQTTKQTITEFLSKASGFVKETGKENLKQSAQMAGFQFAHNALDYVWGARPDLGVKEVVEAGEHAFLSGGLLSAMAAKGNHPGAKQLTARGLWELSKKGDKVRDLLDRDTTLDHAELQARKETLKKAEGIAEDMGYFEKLTQPEKEFVLLHEIHQSQINKKLEEATSQVLRDQLQRDFHSSREEVQRVLAKRGYVPESKLEGLPQEAERFNPEEASSEQIEGINSNEAKTGTEEVPGRSLANQIGVDTLQNLENGRKKQVIESDGSVKEVEFTKEDLGLELDRLETLAEKGKLTEEEFQKSYFGQSTATNILGEAKAELSNNAKGFAKELRESIEGAKLEVQEVKGIEPIESSSIPKEEVILSETKENPVQEAPSIKELTTQWSTRLREFASVIEGDKTVLKSDLTAIPRAVVSTALKGAATILDATGSLAEALTHFVKHVREYYEKEGKPFNEESTVKEAKALFETLGIKEDAPRGEQKIEGGELSVPQDSINRIAGAVKPSRSIVKSIEESLKKNFTHHGALPEWMSGLKEQAQGSTSAYIRKAEQLSKKLQDAYKKEGLKDWEPIDRMLRGEGSEGVPESMQPIVKQMRATIDGISQDLIIGGYVTPSQALVIEGNMGKYLTRSYRIYNEKRWAEKVPLKVKQDAARLLMQQAYKELSESMPHEERLAQAERMAETRMNEILSGVDEVYGIRSKVSGKDLGILQQRQDIPAEIRALLGEYSDPSLAFAITVAKLASLKSNATFLSKVRGLGLGSIFFEKNDPNRPPTHSVEVKAESSESWAPLNGLMTTPEVAKEFAPEASKQGTFIQYYMQFIGAIRWGKTVASPVTQIKNFESNVGFALMNGHLTRPENFVPAFQFLRSIIGNKNNAGKAEPFVQKLMELGLVNQSVPLQEMKKMLKDDNLNSLLLNSEKQGVGHRLRKVYDYLNKVYSGSDAFWKMYGFLAEAQAVSLAKHGKKYEELSAAEIESIDLFVAERIKNTYPTYSRVWKGAKFLSERVPVLTNFVSFQAESLRVFLNSFRYAIKDIKSEDPALRSLGMTRLVGGIIPYIGARTAMNYILAQIAGQGLRGILSFMNSDEENERAEDFKHFVPPYMRSANKLFIPEGGGKYIMYDISALDPYGAIYKTINAYKDGTDLDEEGGLDASLMELLTPFAEPEMFAKSVSEAISNKDAYERQIYNSDDSKETKVGKSLAYVFSQMKPSALGIAERISETGKWEAELAALTGLRPYHIDVTKSLSITLSRTGKVLQDITGDFRADIYKGVDEEEATRKANERIVTQIQRLHELYLSTIRLGGEASEVQNIILQKSGLSGFSGRVKAAILSGNIPEEGWVK